MSKRSRRKKTLLTQPQSKTTKGIAGGIGLLSDGRLNIFIPGTPPSRWFKARSQTGELVCIRVDYNVDGSPKYAVELERFDLGPETEDSHERRLLAEEV